MLAPYEKPILGSQLNGEDHLTVGEREKPIPIRYVENQKQHHAAKTTNAWLERSDDGDEEGHQVCEERPEYGMGEGEEFLF